MMATGATAAKTIKANDRKIIEHMRINPRIQTTSTAMAVTTTAPPTPPAVPELSDTMSHSRPEPAAARWKPNKRINTRYGSLPRVSNRAVEAESVKLESLLIMLVARKTSGTASAPPSSARPIRRGCWLTKPAINCTIMTTTSGVIITTIHQLVRPLTMLQSDGLISERPNAPVMNDHIQDAMLSKIPAT
nr:hypothetical protein [Arthrobacter sp. GMC3]